MSENKTDDLIEWLGDAAEDLTEAQMEILRERDKEIEALYPEEDARDEREAALSAVLMFLLADAEAEQVRRGLIEARAKARLALVAAGSYGVMLVRGGMSEVKAAEMVGIDRVTLRDALGKPRSAKREAALAVIERSGKRIEDLKVERAQ